MAIEIRLPAEDELRTAMTAAEVAVGTGAAQDALGEEQSNVTLMTIHNAKGLEFRAVFVVGIEEEILPSMRSIEEQGVEEERRLFYVGLTRAEEKLTPPHASSCLLWGRTTSHLPSRFLDELPERNVERERLRPSSWRSYGSPSQTRDIAPRADHPQLATGDSVRHGTLGEGVIRGSSPAASSPSASRTTAASGS